MRRKAGEATIARLEVHGGGGDATATRQRVEGLLGSLELRAGALAPSAILCVRELRDPLPGKLSLTSRQLHAPPAWEQALQREVNRLASAAAWPARAAVAPAAEAVAFADEAELLACLGSDLVNGALPDRWWWRLLIRGIESKRLAVVRAWRGSVEAAPAALERLDGRGEAAGFIRALEDADVRALAASIAERFALPVLARATASATGSAPAGHESPARETLAPANESEVPPPPWVAWTGSAGEADLPPHHRALLGIALTLVRAPAIARSTEFAAQVARWCEAVEAPFRAVANAAPGAAREPSLVATPPPRAQGPSTGAEERASEAGIALAAEELPPAGAASEGSKAIHGVQLAQIRAGEEAQTLAEPGPAFESGPAVVEAGAADPGNPPAPPARSPPPAPRKPLSLRSRVRAFGPAIDTELGGLFYLVNLALYLRLYGDDDNLPLPLWDFVELVGRRLLSDPAADGDAVWLLLADLSGRAQGDPPGADFAPPPDFFLPARSLQLPGQPDLASIEPPQVLPGDPLERWLCRLLPYLRARLRLALALEADQDLPAVLLRHRARVHLTDTQLDIVSSLETLPVAIRLAGLDRDPGWIAAAGRFVAFHFE